MATSIQNMTDSEALAHENALLATISADLPSYAPLVAADMTASGALRDDFADKLLAHNQAQAAANAATQAKDMARKLMDEDKSKIRNLVKAHGISPDKYAALNFPSGPVGGEGGGAGATVPVATVDNSERLRQTIHFADASSPNIKRRPKGTVGCEIWLKIDGPPPGNETECTFLTLDSQTPHVVEFNPADAGKMAHYLLRWQFTNGSKSAWGDTISATITA